MEIKYSKEEFDGYKHRFIVILKVDNVSIRVIKPYISFLGETKMICYVKFRKSHITIGMGRGNINPDGTKSKNYFDIDDPKGITEEGSWEWKSGVKGNVYRVRFDKDTDIDYLMFLINQKVKSN